MQMTSIVSTLETDKHKTTMKKHLKLFYTNYIMRTPYNINYNKSMPYELEITFEKWN